MAQSPCSQLLFADLNGDGKDDIYIRGTIGYVIYSGPGYTYENAELHPITRGSPDWLFAQLTDDKQADGLLTWTPAETKTANWEWKVYHALPRGSLFVARTMSDDEHQRIRGPILFGDFNGDGKADIFTTEVDPKTDKKRLTRRYFWTVQMEPGQPPAVLNNSYETTADLTLGDFNGDGTTDVLAPGYWRVSDKGTGNYVPLAQGEPVSASSIKVGDFNGDGADDLLRFDGTGLSVLYGRKGDGLSGNWVSFGCGELVASE